VQLSLALIARIVATRSPHIQQDFGGTSFTILCTVEEGIACRFATSDWGDSNLAPLTEAIVDELGWKLVEHSARRQVIIRYANGHCEMDRGDGYQPVELI
jgi:hypothetical protein